MAFFLLGFLVVASSGSVAVSIKPLALLCKGIVGNSIEVFTVIPPGASPHLFSPSPSVIKDLSRVRILFVVGAGLEFWLDDVKNLVKGQIVQLSEGMELIGRGERKNPHVWVSPKRAIFMAGKMKATLQRVFPDRKEEFENNYRLLLSRLRELDFYITERVKRFSSKKIVLYHPSWTYLLLDYGLEQVAVVEKKPGEPPTPRQLARIASIIKKENVKLLITEPGPQRRFAKTLASQAGINYVILDPLASEKNYGDYVEFINENFDKIEKVLGNVSSK